MLKVKPPTWNVEWTHSDCNRGRKEERRRLKERSESL
jgi:hypothetical protein